MLTKLKILKNVDKVENVRKILTNLKISENVDKVENVEKC